MQTLNKGEWSESYCVLRVIADGKLQLCNSDLLLTGEQIKINGGTISPTVHYKILGDIVELTANGASKEVSLKHISELASKSLFLIKSANEKTFSLPEIADLFGTQSLKAKASDKIDTIINVFDDVTNANEKLGFSIKSFLAGSPTLVNASRATNFTYNVALTGMGLKYKDLKAKTLLRSLNVDNINVTFDKIDSDIYQNNLMRIDLKMPEILAEFLKIYYSSKTRLVRDITAQLQELNPLQIADKSLYKSKITDYLFYSAVGMFPNKNWQGIADIDGGCMIVEGSGEVKTFYIFRKAFLLFFREYLFNKCFLDTPSTTRHGFARLYEENGNVKLKLNLQIRIER